MTNTPTFSVITVCLNSDSTITRTIESVLTQTEQDFEYIIIDGGSTDKTLEILKVYENKYPKKIKYYSEKDDGIYDAMNKGISHSSGKYIGIINSDDWYELDCLAKVKEHILGNDQRVVVGMLNVWDMEKKIKSYINYESNIKRESLTHPSTFVPRSVYNELGAYELSYKYASDYEFYIRLINNKSSFIYINSVLANFSLGGCTESSFSRREALKIQYENGFANIFIYYLKSIYLTVKGYIK